MHALFFLLALLLPALQAPAADERICAEVFASARAGNLADRPITEIVETVAKRFLGAPYEAKTLDRDPQEHVVTNLRTFDCVTLVENVLALARCIKKNTTSFEAYRHELETIRYRGGACSGYASRLHYFSDWIADGEAKGTVRNVTKELGGRPVRKRIDFISAHRSLYPRLLADSAMRAVERRLTAAPQYHLPAGAAAEIPAGAIVAVAASVPGLDVTHTGIAVRGADGFMHLLHAPDVGDSVRISREPLARAMRNASGLIIVLPLPPRQPGVVR